MDNSIKPKISIVTITRNRAGFIAAAIQSVLNQSFSDWELLVLDDASTDETEAIVKKFADPRIHYIKNTTVLGISSNRNKGLALAQGGYIAVLDSDDVWTDTGKLQKQISFLEQNPEYVLIGSNIQIVDEKGMTIKKTEFPTDDQAIRAIILKNNPIPHSAVLYRKDAAKKIGGYNNRLSCVEDLDLFLKLGQNGKFKNLKETTTAYTRHSGGTSYQRKLAMAWNHYTLVLKNFGKYPHWMTAMTWAKLRLLKSLF